jgi:hypothetical protein
VDLGAADVLSAGFEPIRPSMWANR